MRGHWNTIFRAVFFLLLCVMIRYRPFVFSSVAAHRLPRGVPSFIECREQGKLQIANMWLNVFCRTSTSTTTTIFWINHDHTLMLIETRMVHWYRLEQNFSQAVCVCYFSQSNKTRSYGERPDCGLWPPSTRTWWSHEQAHLWLSVRRVSQWVSNITFVSPAFAVRTVKFLALNWVQQGKLVSRNVVEHYVGPSAWPPTLRCIRSPRRPHTRGHRHVDRRTGVDGLAEGARALSRSCGCPRCEEQACFLDFARYVQYSPEYRWTVLIQ